MPGRVDFGFLFDLCSANGWTPVLPLLDDGRHALRVVDASGVVLAGVRFDMSETRLDEAAAEVFDVLHKLGHA